MYRFARTRGSVGYTLAELLVVVSIIGVVALMFILMNWRKSIYAGTDAQRKTALLNIRRGFEEYYNDRNCYPAVDVLATCDGNALSPYLSKIPCDPVTNEPYKFVPESATNLCLGNRICTKLQDLSDPDIIKLGCDPQGGCGWGAFWNYCLASGTTATPAGGFDASVTPTLTPTPTPSLFGPYACRPGLQLGGIVLLSGSCNNVGNPSAYGCPYSFAENDCQSKCGQIPYWCAQ